MKRCIKSLILWITIISMVGSLGTSFVFAEDEQPQQTQNTDLKQSVSKIINNLEVFSRYPNVTGKTLYKTAFEAIFEENPEMYQKVLKAVLSSIDENSAYYNKEEADKFLLDLNEEVTGIGVSVLASEGNIIVSQPIPGSPAEKGGIKAGDIIIAADDYDLRGMDYEAALDKIRGKEGTVVKIKIIRSGVAEPISIDIKREKVAQIPVDYEVIETENKKVAKITIYSFTEITAESFKAALLQADEDGIDKIVIDLRNNGGGYLDQAVAIADMFLPKGKIITTEDHKIDVFDKVFTSSGNIKKNYKIAILVNGMSASASEVLTAALVENGVAKAVGEKTFGKGTVQTMGYTDDGGIIKYTTAYYLTPSGENIHKIGITPNYTVTNTFKPVDMSEFDMFSLSKTYKRGDSGAEVELAKRMLDKLGIFVGEINEVYDENLKIAIAAYQKAKGLFPYGVLDITTQLNLYDTLKTVEVESDDQLQAAIDIL